MKGVWGVCSMCEWSGDRRQDTGQKLSILYTYISAMLVYENVV